uniref:CDP-alcohol phosphatidyltransferase family protein n=1 Tax=Desulfobacca acetoxidans TaxID=60893 RepID=A0A7V4G900_9BACT
MLLANLITLARLPVLLAVLGFLFWAPPWPHGLVGTGLLVLLFLMDWTDGWVARRRGEVTALGAVLDVALDRAVENILWIAFLKLDLVPFWVPVVFLLRSFVVDGIREVAAAQGRPGFTMMHTPLGRFLVASRFMRALYGLAKGVTFASLFLYHSFTARHPFLGGPWSAVNTCLIWFTVALCLLRGLPVVLDGRLYFRRNTSTPS